MNSKQNLKTKTQNKKIENMYKWVFGLLLYLPSNYSVAIKKIKNIY